MTIIDDADPNNNYYNNNNSCAYYCNRLVGTIFSSSAYSIKVLHLNIRSAKNNFWDLQILLQRLICGIFYYCFD